MITEETAQEMMRKLTTLRKKADKTKDKQDLQLYRDYESECLNTFRYFVLLKTGRYRKFANYEDLTQEGMEALLKAMKTFKDNRGSFFFWAGLFVNTRVVRSANNHTVIRYPMHVAKRQKPRKESNIPVMLDPDASPEDSCEEREIKDVIASAIKLLSAEEREVISLFYGFGEDKPLSITKICEKRKMNRVSCLRVLEGAMDTLRQEIDI